MFKLVFLSICFECWIIGIHGYPTRRHMTNNVQLGLNWLLWFPPIISKYVVLNKWFQQSHHIINSISLIYLCNYIHPHTAANVHRVPFVFVHSLIFSRGVMSQYISFCLDSLVVQYRSLSLFAVSLFDSPHKYLA